MVVLKMCESDDVKDHRGNGDGVSYVDGDGESQGDGLEALRPLHYVYLVVLPDHSDVHLRLRTDIMLPSDGFPRTSRRAAESTTPPQHSHMRTGMDSDFFGFLYPADLRDASEETMETGMNRVFVGYGEDGEERFGDGDAGGKKLGGRVRLPSDSEVGFGDGDAGGKKLGGRVRLPPDLKVGFGAACHRQQQQQQVDDENRVNDDVPVPQEFSWAHVLGAPMEQTVPDTCALVASTVCLEAQHRLRFEEKYGRGTFPCRAAAPRKLRAACFRHKYWDSFAGKFVRTWAPGQGAHLSRVLTKLKEIGGARTTNAPPPAPFFLPLADWTSYSYCDMLTPERAARLIFERGPCIGRLFSMPGCRRQDREMLIKKDPGRFGMHAVVCYAYKHAKSGRKLKIRILDNDWTEAVFKWVNFEEFDDFYVLYVYPLPPRRLLGRSPPLEYPVSERKS